MDYYEERFSDWFFGRDTEADRIITNLRSSRLTLVHAESGVGKSSLLRAGVAARLRQLAGGRRRARFIPVVFSKWQDDPLPVLIGEIEAAVRPFVAEGTLPALPRDSLTDAITSAAAATQATLLLILDQFEEYFLYTAKERTPQRLAVEIARAVNDVNLTANFVIAIREDAYAWLGDLFKGRISNVYGNYLDVASLSRQEADEAIRRPLLEVYNRQPGIEPVSIEEELVAAVIRQVPSQDGDDDGSDPAAGDGHANGHVAAPLLQLVMETIWNRERSNNSDVLRLSTLNELEGVERIVDTHLAKALRGLEPEQREIAIDAFDHLVTPSGGKIAESIPDLASRTSHSEDVLTPVLERLDDARILRPVAPPPGRSRRYRRYEIFHDVLAPAINRAIETRQAERLEQERLDAEREATAERARARRLKTVAIVACSLLVLAVAAVVFALAELNSANDESAIARRQSANANSGRLAASAEQVAAQNPELATRLSLRALRSAPTDAAQTALRQTLAQTQPAVTLTPAAPIRTVAYSGNGDRLMVAAADGMIRIFDAHGNARLKSFGDVEALTGAAIDRSGTRVAASYSSGTVRVWNATTGRQQTMMTPPDGFGLSAVAISPDGRLVAAAGADDKVRIWNSSTRRLLRVVTEPHEKGDQHVLLDASFDADAGRIVAASSSGHALIWDTATGRLVRSLAGHLGLLDASFSADGSRVVTASGDGSARVWNVTTGNALHTFAMRAIAGQRAPYMWSATLSPDGARLVTGAGNGVARIWRSDAPDASWALAQQTTGAITSTAYSPDGGRIALGNAIGQVTIWGARDRRRLTTLTPTRTHAPLSRAIFTSSTQAILATRFGSLTIWRRSSPKSSVRDARWHEVKAIAVPEDDPINSVAATRNDRVLATAGASGNVWLWNLPSGQPLEQMWGGAQSANDVQFDPVDQNEVLVADDDTCARIFRVASQRQVGRSMCHAGYDMKLAAFSPDGRRILTSSDSGDAELWDATTSRHRRIGLIDSGFSTITGAAFSPDGRHAVVSGNSVADIDRTTGSEHFLSDLSLTSTEIEDAAYSPDGKSIATASSDGLARIWDASSDQTLLTLGGHDGPVKSVAFSPDGQSVITASADGTAKVWEDRPADQQQVLPGRLFLATVAFDPRDSRIVATASENARHGVLALWNRGQAARPVARLALPSSSNGAASAEFSADGRYLAATDGAERADVFSVSQILRSRNTARPVVVLDANTDRSACSSSHVASQQPQGFESAELSADGRLAVTADQDGSACVWDVRSRRPLKLLAEPSGASGGLSNSVEGAAPLRWAMFSPSASKVLTASSDGTARIWNWRAGKHGTLLESLADPSGEGLNDAFFNANGTRVVTSTDAGDAGIWDANTGQEIRQLLAPDRAAMYNANFSPNGRRVVTCQASDVTIFDAWSGRLLTDLPYGSATSDCEFSPDGRLVATAGQGGQVRMFSTSIAGNVGQIERIAKGLVATR